MRGFCFGADGLTFPGGMPFAQNLCLFSQDLGLVCSFLLQLPSLHPRIQTLLAITCVQDVGSLARALTETLRGSLSCSIPAVNHCSFYSERIGLGCRMGECSLRFHFSSILKYCKPPVATAQFHVILKPEIGGTWPLSLFNLVIASRHSQTTQHQLEI